MTLYESIAWNDHPAFEKLLAEGRGGVNEVYVYRDDSELHIDDENIGSRSLPVVMAAAVCASTGDDRFLRRLAEAGADVDAPVADGGTHPEGYKYPDGTTALAVAGSNAPFVDMAVRTLAELGADLHRSNSEGETYLDRAIGRRAALAAVALVEAGFDRTRSKRYAAEPYARHWLDVVAPAEYAVTRGGYERLKKSLEDGLRLAEATTRTFSFLGLACRNNYPDLVRLLLDAGADPNAGDPDGATPLMVACRWADTETVSLRLEHGADWRRRDGSGRDWADHARQHPQNRTLDFVMRFLTEGRE